jgi:uncharacterized membrane protein
METVRLEIGRILGLSLQNLGQWWLKALILVMAYTALGTLVDINIGFRGTFLSNIVSFVIDVVATHAALTMRYGHNYSGRLRFGGAFGLSFLTGLAVIVGLILFIVPGMVLATWWAVSLPAMMREDLGVSEAMERSKALTDGNRWRVLGLMLLLFVPFILLVLAISSLALAFGGPRADEAPTMIALSNLLTAGYVVFAPVCWVETYGGLGGESTRFEDLEDVFA